MAVIPTVSVDISLQTSGVSRAGFGTPVFIGAHRWFTERVREYSSKSSAAEDMPTNSEEYQAISAAFSQSPPPASIKIGRREADVILTPTTPEIGDVFTVVVTVNDGDFVTASYTSISLDTAEDVVDAIKATIDGDVDVAAHVTTTKNGTGAATTLTIAPTTTADVFTVSDFNNISFSFTTVETAPDVLTAIKAEDDDFAVITAHDHSVAFVQAMAGEVEGTDDMYFVSSQEATSLTSYSIVATDLLAVIKQGNYLNTVSFFHPTADTTFPEVSYFSYNAIYQPGKVVWTGNQLKGVTLSTNPTTGLALSLTEQGYLNDRNASYLIEDQGLYVTRGGLTSSGEKIDVVRSKHYWTARLTEALKNLLYNQQGTKIGYNNPGINAVRSVCISVSDRLVSTDTNPNMLDSFTFTFPSAQDADPADKAAGILRGTFVGYLTGAIEIIAVQGTLTYAI